jgi:uncharacterized protein YcgL (UPF0745 family)
MNLLCQVFKSSRQAEMYLYVELSRGLQDVPSELLASFGEPAPVLSLLLTQERKLARADAAAVMASIARQGFYLQMPPGKTLIASENATGDHTC